MNAPRHLLALGLFSSHERAVLAQAAREAAIEMTAMSDAATARHWLSEHSASALLIDGESPEADAFAVERRAEAAHSTLPVFVWATEVSDLAFAEAFSWGADDVMQRGALNPLLSRLRQLPKEPIALPASNRGTVLVADDDRSRRIVLGRVLRNAGWSVTFAINDEDLFRFVSERSVDLVVSNTTLTQEPKALLERLQEQGKNPLFVLNTPPRLLHRYRGLLGDFENVSVTDGFAPAENVLFVSNELGRPRGGDKRKSARLLYGTAVGFRSMGREMDDYGYSYNISEGGLYVRTLAPPADDIAWLELVPPRSDRRVRLVGQVVWRRGLAKGEFATVPPGFGVQIVDGAKLDLDHWNERYEQYGGDLNRSLRAGAPPARVPA